MSASLADILPEDAFAGVLVGRVLLDDGPHVVAVREEALFDLSQIAPTMSDLFDLEAPAEAVRATRGERLAGLAEAMGKGVLLAPCDLSAIKAAGVTFVGSLIERLVEERAEGDPAAAEALRDELNSLVGGALRGLKPGSEAAAALKTALVKKELWSQYLEVAIGPDAEIFTKAQPLSAVGWGARIGIHPRSAWSNPEPEIVLACSARGEAVGASLGNDVNLRDFEGRSALLLARAKDNNASCAIGPFVRLFDTGYSLDDVRRARVCLDVTGPDGFSVRGEYGLEEISRDPLELVAAAWSEHQYPDGLMLFLGAGHVPTDDRRGLGQGFTHVDGDRVRIASPGLGVLLNTVARSNEAGPWTFGARALMHSLARRGLV
ncbi:MAG: fumarylacetoacetate hydrolase family protein [Caulobacteraceae bacterium]